MIYDLAKIEAHQIEKAHKNRLYRVERDRLKSRCFIYLNYPKINYHGLNISEAKRYVYADFIARFERLIGRNVLFSIGYNNLDSSIYLNANKLDKPLYNYCASQYALYQKELKLLDISFDEEKEILFSSEEFVKYVQQIFLFFYEKKLISYKKGYVVSDDKKIYQLGEYVEKEGKCYSLDGELLNKSYRNYYALKLSTIKKDLVKDINNLNVNYSVKNELLNYLCYRNELEVLCNTTADELLKIKIDKPEYICGISYICLNPNYIDIKPFINSDEESNSTNLSSDLLDFIYSGTDLINPIIFNHIPIFISKKYDKDIYVGIPSLNDTDEAVANELELDFNPVLDYINDECVLVNSGRYNGMTLLEANQLIKEYLIKDGLAVEFKEIKLDELIISSNFKFGVPIPLHNDGTTANIPVVYNLKHDVKLELGDLADKNLVKEFLTDDFVKNLLPNAIRLREEIGIIDFESIEALNEIGLFPKADVSLVKSYDYLSELIYNLIFNKLFARYYTSGFDCEFKNILFVNPVLDQNNMIMHRDNNNLVSVGNLIREFGSTIIRAYYASLGLDESSVYFEEDINEIVEVVDKIVKIYYYPIDDVCIDLDIAYQRMIDVCYMAAKKYDFKLYFEAIINFVKKVHEVKHISRAQAKGLLIILSVVMPSLAEQIKEDVLNLREPLYYFSWPE